MMAQRNKLVLIVDDDEGCRTFVQAIMEDKGWETLEGRTGHDAIELANKEKPDLIILDVMMPEMDGFEAFRHLRSDYFTKDIPIIMLTAINELDPEGRHSDDSMAERFGLGRPEGFVDKPVDSRFLLDTIFGVVGNV